MKIVTSLASHDLNTVGDVARRAQAQGFAGVATQENRHEPFLPLAIAATQTQTLELRTSVAIAFPRSPMLTASIAWDIQTAAKGRFVLGLGTQIKAHNVRRFSVPWSAPAPRMREYIQSLRAIFDCWQNGAPLNYQGQHYQFSLMTPNFSPAPLDSLLPPIHVAAVGPAMLKLAGQECDGVMLHPFCTRKYAEEVVLPRVGQGLAKSGRQRGEFEISGGGFVATGADDEAVHNMFEWVRKRVGFYGSTPAYWPVFELHGLEDLGFKLIELSKQGMWEQMSNEISDDVVHLFAAVGRFDEIENIAEQRFAHLTDVITMPATTPSDLIQDLARIATAAVGN